MKAAVRKFQLPGEKQVTLNLSEVLMECANCRRNREQGQSYQFHPARKIGSDEHFDVERLAKIRQTRYLIAAPEQAWICDRCADRTYKVYLWFYIIVTPFALGSMIGILGGQAAAENAQTLLGGLACCLVPWLALGGLLLAVKKRWRKALGERYAIKSRKKELRQQGFDSIFTPAEYARLERPI